MFIHYNSYDLFGFFENDPITISDVDAGEYIYIYEYNKFKLILSISVYEKYIDLSITFNENIVISQRLKNVNKIEKGDLDELKIYTDDNTQILLKKEPQIGAIITNQ